VVTACRDRNEPRLVQPLIELVDLGDDTCEVECARQRCIADVGDARQLERDDLGQGVVVEDVAGLVPNLARTVSRAGALGEAGVRRQTDECDINLPPILAQVGAKERGDSRVRLEVHVLAIRQDSLGHFVKLRLVHMRLCGISKPAE